MYFLQCQVIHYSDNDAQPNIKLQSLSFLFQWHFNLTYSITSCKSCLKKILIDFPNDIAQTFLMMHDNAKEHQSLVHPNQCM